MDQRQFFVYVMTNEHNRVLYIGVTSDLSKRARQHRTGSFRGFTQDYNLRKLIYFEACGDAKRALERQKQLKSWHRQWKIDLIKQTNPRLRDLSGGL
ncbi:MAG TPA: GIY-YIG nuclease family protein [Candidatus Saccharimonadales bacterium]|nr:GIY-YIG nuclease family protein [Candidatus Saccharimonadales bacterium]